ncbi:hypothetical protein [Arsenophonus sp. PmNCSU2021_1]|uniref:hypothetical protein n=1 Tax=Arsenophonus sp. PmNCSU2021_1 TaxID=3118989 RepID=UPI002FEFAAE5
MGQVAFDTLKFVETLEGAGLPKDQAKAISLAVRESHQAVDVATKRDLGDVRKEIDGRFDKVDARFEKIESQIADVRKDLSAEITNVRKDLSSEIALVRKDVEHIANGLLLKLGGVIVVTISAATAILKFF